MGRIENRAAGLLWAVLALSGCASSDSNTIASLRNQFVEIKDVQIDGGVKKAMESYEQFLKNTPETAMTPEAIRRLADLKIQQEYDGMESGQASVTNEVALKEIKPQQINAGKSLHEENKANQSVMAN
ncbi:MAG: hypothetical protein OEZ23_08635, partial [Gammaproteobacteria bacterium]|nr:hypothetical protein [Gammaproteobacteria bacterium]